MTTLPIKSNNETYSLLCGEESYEKLSGTVNGCTVTVIAIKLGRVVELDIRYTGDLAKENTLYTILTLSEKYRPIDGTKYLIVPEYVNNVWWNTGITRYMINSDGTIKLYGTSAHWSERSGTITYIGNSL